MTLPNSQTDQERWVVVETYPNYEVSDAGRVRRRTGGARVRAGWILRPQDNGRGYQLVHLWRDGVGRKITVHSLVAAAFLGPRPPRTEVNHRDGVKRHNAAANLEYVTSAENKAHAARLGLTRLGGSRHPTAKLSDEEIDALRASWAGGTLQREIAARFGITQAHVSNILRGKRRRLPGMTGVTVAPALPPKQWLSRCHTTSYTNKSECPEYGPQVPGWWRVVNVPASRPTQAIVLYTPPRKWTLEPASDPDDRLPSGVDVAGCCEGGA